MPSPIPDETRTAILEDLESDTEESCRTIAKRHGVSDATVRKIAKDEGFTNAFTRADTKNATEAAAADNAARRAELSRRFLEEAKLALDEMHRPHLAFAFGGKDNTFAEKELPSPPTGDKRNLMIIAATAVDKSMALDKHDSGAGAEQLGSLLGGMFAEMTARHAGPEA